jgi:hypothetical protein
VLCASKVVCNPSSHAVPANVVHVCHDEGGVPVPACDLCRMHAVTALDAVPRSWQLWLHMDGMYQNQYRIDGAPCCTAQAVCAASAPVHPTELH